MSDNNERISYSEAAEMLGVDGDFAREDLYSAYRERSSDVVEQQAKLDEAFEVVNAKMHGIDIGGPEPAPQMSGAVLAAYARMAEEEEKKKEHRRKLDETLPESAPAGYRRARGIAQHFPYRIAFLGLVALICWWNFADMSIWTNIALLIAVPVGFLNTVYPIITKPIRYKIIEAVDDSYEMKYKREQMKNAGPITTEKEKAQDHKTKYGTERMVPGDGRPRGDGNKMQKM